MSFEQFQHPEICTEESMKSGVAGRWTNEEHELFLKGLNLYQKQWKAIAEFVKTRTVVQVRTHAQKYFQKLEKAGGKPQKNIVEVCIVSPLCMTIEQDAALSNSRTSSIGSEEGTPLAHVLATVSSDDSDAAKGGDNSKKRSRTPKGADASKGRSRKRSASGINLSSYANSYPQDGFTSASMQFSGMLPDNFELSAFPYNHIEDDMFLSLLGDIDWNAPDSHGVVSISRRETPLHMDAAINPVSEDNSPSSCSSACSSTRSSDSKFFSEPATPPEPLEPKMRFNCVIHELLSKVQDALDAEKSEKKAKPLPFISLPPCVPTKGEDKIQSLQTAIPTQQPIQPLPHLQELSSGIMASSVVTPQTLTINVNSKFNCHYPFNISDCVIQGQQMDPQQQLDLEIHTFMNDDIHLFDTADSSARHAGALQYRAVSIDTDYREYEKASASSSAGPLYRSASFDTSKSAYLSSAVSPQLNVVTPKQKRATKRKKTPPAEEQLPFLSGGSFNPNVYSYTLPPVDRSSARAGSYVLHENSNMFTLDAQQACAGSTISVPSISSVPSVHINQHDIHRKECFEEFLLQRQFHLPPPEVLAYSSLSSGASRNDSNAITPAAIAKSASCRSILEENVMHVAATPAAATAVSADGADDFGFDGMDMLDLFA